MKVKRLLVLLPLMIIFFLQQSITAQAEDFSYLKIKVTTDKQEYTESESINYTLTITNASGSKAKNVVVSSTIPDGLEVTSKNTQIENGKAVWKLDTIGGFGQATLNFAAKLKKGTSAVPPVSGEVGKDTASTGGNAPKTGDDTSFLPYYFIFILSIAVVIGALLLLKKNRVRKPVTFILILAMILPSFTVAKAEEKKETITENYKVTVDKKEYKLSVTVESVLDVDTTLLLKAKRNFGIPQLEWNTVEGATYTVKRGLGLEKLEVIAEEETNTYYVDDESQQDVQYYYQVIAIKEGKEVHHSSIVFVLPFIDSDHDGLSNHDEDSYKTKKDNSDTDNDGLKDGEEVFIYKTDPLKADTDGDGLFDKFETSFENDSNHLSPLLKDSDGNGTPDGEEDSDEDGLTNLQEQESKTNPFNNDTDSDNLLDQEELNTYKTNPLLADTDQDGLDDDSELKFETNPNLPDTDGDGILDGDEVRTQKLESSELNVSVSFDSKGDAHKTTSIEEEQYVVDLMGEQGMVGVPVDIKTTSEFTDAKLTFSYDPEKLGDINEDHLGVFYFNTKTLKLEIVEDQAIDKVNHTVTANLPHFSTYLLADQERWAASFIQNSLPIGAQCKQDEEQSNPLDLVFVIDSSGSMLDNDPNNYRISGAKEIINSLRTGDQMAIVDDQAAVVDFDSYAQMLQPLTNNKPLLISALDEIDSSGGTNIGSGVYLALEELKTVSRDSNKIIILLTDGEGSYSTSYTTRAKEMGVKIFTIGLGDYIDQSLLESIALGTDGDFYHTVTPEQLPQLFEKARDVAVEKDTDKDCIPDWVEKLSVENGYIIEGTLSNSPVSSDFNEMHSDDDGLTDLEELSPMGSQGTVEAGLTNLITDKEKNVIHLKDWPRSHPMLTDTDYDTKNDKVDVIPLIPKSVPVVFIHGINDNSDKLWGLETFVSNSDYDDSKRELITDDLGKYEINVLDGFTPGFKGGMDALVEYSDINTQYIRGYYKNKKRIGEYLIDNKHYRTNRDVFVFNWENNHHIDVMAGKLEGYLKGLSDHFKEYGTSSGLDIYNDQGIAEFNLVGHSAGGIVSRFYVENLMSDTDPQINKLIALDSPHFGSGWATAGGNTTIGGKGCTNVLDDLRLNYAYLQTSDKDLIKGCSEKSDSYLKLDHPNTDYHFIGGFVVEPRGLDFGQVKIGTHLEKDFTLDEYNESNVDDRVDEIIYDQKVLSVWWPGGYAPANAIPMGGRYGDEVVSIYSELGIPLNKQFKFGNKVAAGSWNGYRTIEDVSRYIYFGSNKKAEHNAIPKVKEVQDLIIDILEK